MTDRDPSVGIDHADQPDRDTTYLLRRIPAKLWQRARARAKAEGGGNSMRVILISLIDSYVAFGRPGNKRARRPAEPS